MTIISGDSDRDAVQLSVLYLILNQGNNRMVWNLVIACSNYQRGTERKVAFYTNSCSWFGFSKIALISSCVDYLTWDLLEKALFTLKKRVGNIRDHRLSKNMGLMELYKKFKAGNVRLIEPIKAKFKWRFWMLIVGKINEWHLVTMDVVHHACLRYFPLWNTPKGQHLFFNSNKPLK